MATTQALQGQEFTEFLEDLLETNSLEGPALGITKKVSKEGLESLSDKQAFVFMRDVINEFTTDCNRGCAIPWSEMLHAYHNGGYCSYCYHLYQKMLRE